MLRHEMSIIGTSYLLYPGFLALIAGIWYQQVNSTVQDPYLVSIDHLFFILERQLTSN